MGVEKLYTKLPNFLKYNRVIFNFSMKLSTMLSNVNHKSKIIDSQHELMNFIFLNSKFEAKGTLRNTQLLYVELLRFIVNVCNKYDINYLIADGTLLGAVRHGGFIPWDDDIDLALLREDYDRLIEVLPKEISKFEFLKSKCGLTLLKDNYQNYFKNFNSVYDVVNENDLLLDEKFLFLQFAWLKPYVKIDFFPLNFIQKEKLDHFNQKYVLTKYRFYDEMKNTSKDYDEVLKLRNNEVGFVDNKTDYLNYSLDSVNFLPPWIFETNKVFPLSTIKFEGYEFNCPKDVDHYLRVLYGDNYMMLPDTIEVHNIVPFIESQFDSVDEMNKSFDEAISYLREINETFI